MNNPAHCPRCDQPLSAGVCLRCDTAAAFRLVRRQALILSFLVAACGALFLYTRFVAAHVSQTKTRDAASAYSRGRDHLRAGEVEAAAAAFRAAALDDPDALPYSLALAEALIAAGRNEEARGLLLRIREDARENPQINLQLARLAAAGGDLSEAARYYHNALQGIWPPGQEAAQRELRVELIRLLLEHRDREGALSEILVLAKNAAGDVPSSVQVGRLFLDAGAAEDARETFDRALDLEPQNGEALAGAGEALFELGDYARARRSLSAAVAQRAGSPRVTERLEIATLVLSTDPMAPRLGTNERQRRLTIGLDRAIERLRACLDGGSDAPALTPLLDEATALRARLRPGSVRRDPDLPEIGLDLIGRIEAAAPPSCSGPTPLDQALALIGRRHGVADR